MVAGVLVGLWLVVLLPMAVATAAERRRSSVASFEASIRGLDRSASSALALAGGPVTAMLPRGQVTTRRVRRARLRRQQDILGVALVAVVVTATIAVLRLDRSALAVQAMADQLFVGYFAAVLLTNQRRDRA